MFCLVYEGNYEVIALRLLQRRLHLVALYWHPTISLSISFQLKRPTRPIEECSSLPTACICKLSFLIAFAFGNIFYRMQSLFAWCVSITRRTYILWLDLRAIARLLAFCSIDLWFSNMPMAISGGSDTAACQDIGALGGRHNHCKVYRHSSVGIGTRNRVKAMELLK